MPAFEYIAKDSTGSERTGVMQAESETAVMRTLDQRALFPVRISLQSDRAGRGRGRRVKGRELGVAYGQLADLLSAGVPMLRALEILGRAVVNPRLGRLIDRVREDVAAGETLADSMAVHPKVFLDLHVAMVRAGEHAGFLEDVLTNLAGFMERQDELRSKVVGAMIYPIVLAAVGFLAVSGILILLVPKFSGFFGDTPLPLPSRIVFALSNIMVNHWQWVCVSVAITVAAFVSYARSETGKQLWEKWKLKIPVAGLAIRMVAITRFCRVLGTMITNGVPIIQALEISKDASGNAIMAEAIAKAAENVRAGEPLAEPLQRSDLFPVEIVEMIAIGEESNQLEKVLIQVADTVDRRTARQVDAAVRLIEPLMLLLMAGAIGFIAVGLLYPIFTMAQTMQ